jgi:F0F1-type ATP synthase assembly protein I
MIENPDSASNTGNKNDKESEFEKVAKSYRTGWAYAEYAFQYGVAIVLCTMAGYWLDNWLNTGNIFLIFGVIFGAVGGFINLLRALNAFKTTKRTDGK